jgi:hypothetical protein
MSTVAISSRLEDPSLEPAVALQRAVDRAWREREGRRVRYEGKKLGGTVLVHFIKKNEWWEETALVLLGGDEVVKMDSPYPPSRPGMGRVGNGLDNSGRSSDIEPEIGTGIGTGTDSELETETELKTGTDTGEIETETGEEEDVVTISTSDAI